MRVLIITSTPHAGNTNEGLDVAFLDREVSSDQPLVYIADTLEWGEDNVLAVGVKPDNRWQIMSQKEYTDLLDARTKDQEDSSVEAVLGKMKSYVGTTAWDVNDMVAIKLTDDSYCIGYIVEINAGVATVYEVHGFHRTWGGSNAARGMLHHVPLELLYPCPRYYRHIVKGVMD